LGGNDPSQAYTNLITFLTTSDPKYISAKPTDPKDEGDFTYKYITTSEIFNRCPPLLPSGTLATSGITDYSIWTKMERSSDSDAVDSRKNCSDKPTPNGNSWTDVEYAGFYVTCNN
jgi:hypothetical protein